MPEAPEPLFPRPGELPKRSKPYRTSGLTVAEFKRLPHAQQMAVDSACDRGLTWREHDHESGRTIVVGKRSKPS